MRSMINDETQVSADSIHRVLTGVFLEDKKFYDNYYLMCDGSLLSDYLLTSLNIVVKKSFYFLGKCYFVPVCEKSSMQTELFEGAGCNIKELEKDSFSSFTNEKKKTSCVICVLDASENENREKILSSLSSAFSFAKKNKSRVVVGAVLPEMDKIPQNIEYLAEREFDYFVSENEKFSLFNEIQQMCRTAVRDDGCDVSLLRFDNVFSPDRQHIPVFDLMGEIRKAFENETVTITEEDYKLNFTLTYVRDAVASLIHALYNVKSGHEYNVSAYTVTPADIKFAIWSKCKEHLKLKCDVDKIPASEHKCLGTMKWRKTGFEAKCELEIAVYQTVCHLSEIEYDIGPMIAFYEGKLQRLKDLEIYILKEIDRVCRKHNIQYFLAGGSLLGAVRNGKSIEWDDDLDIGMLREDYDKFRKVFEEEMGDEFAYSSPFNKSGSHYTIDKVRLKGTYFSTNFSSKNVNEDGIFIDILVYDKTSNNKLLQKLHMAYLYAITKALEVRWYNEARETFHYRLSKIALPFLRLIPYGVYHRMFELGVRFYRNKKDAKYLIDSVGKKLIHGVMPIDGLEEVKYVPFDGIEAPIPVDPTGYLNYAYGKDYMSLPTYSKRSAPHSFARVDMGEYIFETHEKPQFRSVDVRGELFEKEGKKS